jgi:transposase-like protein
MALRKLSDADKQEILKLYHEPEHTTSTLAERYGVSNSTISRLLKARLPEEEYGALILQKRAAAEQAAAEAAAQRAAAKAAAKAASEEKPSKQRSRKGTKPQPKAKETPKPSTKKAKTKDKPVEKADAKPVSYPTHRGKG